MTARLFWRAAVRKAILRAPAAAALMAAGDAQRAESRAREVLALEPRQETAKRLLAELGDR